MVLVSEEINDDTVVPVRTLRETLEGIAKSLDDDDVSAGYHSATLRAIAAKFVGGDTLVTWHDFIVVAEEVAEETFDTRSNVVSLGQAKEERKLEQDADLITNPFELFFMMIFRLHGINLVDASKGPIKEETIER